MPNKTGVCPCYEGQFQVGATKETLTDIADMETFSIKLDNGIEEWNPYDSEGWVKRLMASKSITISASGKRNFGDTGNDFVADFFMKNGRDAEGVFQWTFPNGDKLVLEGAIFNITNLNTGKSIEVMPLEYDVMSNGKPTYTVATPAKSAVQTK